MRISIPNKLPTIDMHDVQEQLESDLGGASLHRRTLPDTGESQFIVMYKDVPDLDSVAESLWNTYDMPSKQKEEEGDGRCSLKISVDPPNLEWKLGTDFKDKESFAGDFTRSKGYSKRTGPN